MALRADELDPGAVDLDRDRLLVLRYQAGDVAAFDELYRRYYPRLHLYCQRRVHDPHASEELAQEAFVRALRAMPRFAGERRFYPWMTVIAQRLCIDHHRRTARVEPAPEVDAGVFEEDHDALFTAVDREHLTQAMNRLAPRHREVLDLREQRGWSYQQIADHFDVPMTTVEALLHRARKALKREFLAVSTGTRLAGIPIIGWAIGRVARLRARFSGGTAHQLAPVAGSAMAGLAAMTLVLSPFASTPTSAVVTGTAARRAVLASLHTTSTPDSSATHAANAALGSTSRTRTGAPNAPLANAGPVSISTGSEATAQAQQQNSEQPVQIDLHVIQVGLNPEQTASDALQHVPGGTP